jgi:hypothetical protein
LVDRLDLLATLRNIEHIDAVFSQAELEVLATMAHQTGWSASAVAQKAAIIVEERRNYDPIAARDYLLHSIPASRLCLIDTARVQPDAAAARVISWLKNNA